MAKNKFFRILAAAVAVILGIGLLVILEGHTNILLAPEPTEAALQQEPEYNALGMQDSDTLSTEIIYEDEEIVCYTDRVLRKYRDDELRIDFLKKVLPAFLEQNAQIENLVIMPLPLRIMLEEDWSEERESYQKYISALEKDLPSGATLVDVLPVLEQHKDEFVFFRTDEGWTARGAYYGMEKLGDVLDINTFPLEAYEEYRFRSHRGSVYYLAKEKITDEALQERVGDIESDPVFYYLLPAAKNRAEVYTQNEDGTYPVKKPLIAISDNGTNTFVGGFWERAIVEGEGLDAGKENQSALLLCDSGGKMLAPFLANYYDCVYMIDITRFGEFPETVNDIITEYNIKDVVVTQNVLKLGDISYSLVFLEYFLAIGEANYG